jgi:hypothetical protein
MATIVDEEGKETKVCCHHLTDGEK